MKLNSLNISAFGGIKNLSLSLDNNFNVVYGDNENGKTTVMTFIKMMFYGTERQGSQLSKNPRKKYLPWDNSTMAGSIDFENNGRSYRIERIFGSSNSTDKVTLIDLGLGERQSVGADIGVKLFGLSAAAFERSIFIGQFGFPENNNIAVGELNGKLSNIALTGDEAVSYDKVFERLSNAKYELMSKGGKSGIYDKNLKLKAELENRLEKALLTKERITKAGIAAEGLANEIKKLELKEKALKEQIENEQDFRNAEKLRELLKLKVELEEINKNLTLSDGKLADEMYIRKVEFCLSKIQNINTKLSSKQNEISLLENNLELALNPTSDATPEKSKELTERVKALENENNSVALRIEKLENTTVQKPSILWFILAAIFGALGGGLYFISSIITAVSLALAVVLIIIGVANASKIKANASKQQAELLDLKLKHSQSISVLASEKANLTAINAALNSNTAMIENQKKLLEEGKSSLSLLKEEKKLESNTLFTLFSSLKQAQSVEEVTEALEGVKLKALKQKELKQNINYILKDVGNISYTEAEEKLNNLKTDNNIDFEKLKAEHTAVLKTINERIADKATVIAEANAISAENKDPEKIKSELEDLNVKISAQKEYCDCLELALSTLTDSYAEVRQSFGSELEKKAGSIFSELTDQRYNNISISKSFDIAVNKTDVFGSKELDYLSSGTQDQAYLSLRLALAELISEESALPIILDDSLAQYDDTRSQTALKFLKNYSENGQVIMFTCHNSISDFAKDLNANVIKL